MMRKQKLINLILIMVLCILSLTGCSMKENPEKLIEDKVGEEISYLEDEIFTVVNKYIKGEYVKDDKIKWDDVNKDVQGINTVLDTVILDLSEENISNDEIIKFKNGIDQLLIAVGNQDENSLLKINSDIYSLLPTYLEKTSKDKNKINIMKLKSLVLSSLAYSNSLEWENAKNVIGQAETKYKEMMDDVDYMKKYSYNLNKVYVLLEELKNSIDIEEIELCKMKYINFIEKI